MIETRHGVSLDARDTAGQLEVAAIREEVGSAHFARALRDASDVMRGLMKALDEAEESRDAFKKALDGWKIAPAVDALVKDLDALTCAACEQLAEPKCRACVTRDAAAKVLLTQERTISRFRSALRCVTSQRDTLDAAIEGARASKEPAVLAESRP
jgi:hypothetical protein